MLKVNDRLWTEFHDYRLKDDTMYFYLIRHAQPCYGAPGPYHLPPGPGLTDEGSAQAARLGTILAGSGIERVVSSPLRRCVMTAEPLAVALQLNLLIDEDLREGQPEESTADVTVRMLRAALAQSDKRVVALVSHNAPLVYLLQALTHNDIMLPAKDRRGNQLAECMIWAVYNRGGRWKAQHVPPEGTAC